MRHQLDPAIVRISNQVGTAVGLGVLVGPGLVLTCAHVVRDALGLAEAPRDPPTTDLRLDFPLLDGDTSRTGRVDPHLWQPDADVAVLTIDGPLPTATQPVALVTADDLWGHSFRAFGFPKGRSDGVWAEGVMRGRQAQGWLQIDTGPGGYHVEPGFSGGPVWDDALEGVVGLVTRSDPKAGVRAAYVIPTPLLIAAWPELAATSRPPSPYRGLAAFRAVDADNFFGREAYTARLLAEINRKRLLAVLGPSGSGKSSVVFAGLVPVLRSDGWLVIDLRPGRDSFRSLAAALIPHLEPGLSEVDRLVETGKLAAALEAGEVELLSILGRILTLNSSATRVLLIVDQFEELYAFCEIPEWQQRFLDVLLTLQDGGPPQHPFALCLTLRADFMGQALSYRLFADSLQDHDIKLGPMSREELRAATEQPAARLGVAFEPGLVDRILDDVGQEPGNLPLLEFALTLLWEQQRLGRMTHEAYRVIGGVQGALARHAEAVFWGLSAAEQEAARAIFVQLVQPRVGTADTRRQATREEVGDENWPLVQQLAGERLLTTGGDERGRETVEVAHEALIQHWKQLQTWIAEDRTFREWQERLRTAMAMWQASNWDAGALLRGALLTDAEAWLATRGRELPRRERQYISAGIAAREALAREEEGRLKKELAMVRALAKEQARASRGLRRRSVVALAVAAVALLAAAGAIYFWTQAERGRRLAEARELAALSLESMERDPDQALLMAYQAAQRTMSEDDLITSEGYRALHTVLTRPGQPLAILDGHAGLVLSATFSPDGTRIITTSNDGTARLWDSDGQPLTVLKGHTADVRSAAFSPDGTQIVTASNDGTARLWDGDGQPLAILEGHTGIVISAAFSPDGTRIVTASDDNTARLWDGNTQSLAVLEGHLDTVKSAVFSPDRQRIVTASNDGTARLWDSNGQPLAVLEGHASWLFSAAFSPDGQRIVTASNDGTARLWDTEGQQLSVLEGHKHQVVSAVFSPDGRYIVTASTNDPVRLWESDGRLLAVLEVHSQTGAVSSVTFSPDGQQIVTANSDGTAWLWNVDGQLLTVLKGHTGQVESASFSPDGTRILTASYDGTARLWDGDRQPLVVLEGHIGPVESAKFSPDERRIITTSWDSTIRLWDDEGQSLAVLQGHTDGVWSAAFSPDGRRIVSFGYDGTLRLWDSEGRTLAVSEGHAAQVLSVAFSPDGTLIVSASDDGTARLWNSSGQLMAILEGHVGAVKSAAFSPDGTRIVSASDDGTARIWSSSGQPLIVLDGHTDSVNSATFSPNGIRIVTAGKDGTARLWDSEGRPLAVLMGHSDWVRSAGFSPDGTHIVTTSDDGTARLWDREGRPLAVLMGHTDTVWSAAFSPDGQRIATTSWDGTIRLWDSAGRSLAILEGHAGWVFSVVFSSDSTRILTAGWDGTARLWQTYPTVDAMLSEAEQTLARLLPYETCFAELGAALCEPPAELP